MAATNLAFLIFFLLPFQFSLGSFGTSDVPILRLVTPLIVLIWAAHNLISKKWPLPKPLPLFAFTAFLGWMTLSFFWAENPSWAIRKIVFWLSFFPIFLVLISYFQIKEVRQKSLQGLVWGGAAIALVGIIQFSLQFFIPLSVLSEVIFASLPFFLGENFAGTVAQYPSIFVNIGGITFLRALAFFPDPHIFAYYVAMLIPLAGYLAFQKHAGLREKIIPAILLLATLLSFSRASYVALLTSGIILGAIGIWQLRKKISVPAVLALLGIGVFLAFSPIATRFVSSFSIEDGSVSERSRLNHEALTYIKDAPFTGVGLGNYPLLVKPSAEPREPIYVHNLYLDIAVEIGLVGLFFFLLFIFSCLPKPIFSPGILLSYQTALLLSLIIFLTHSLFEYPLFSLHVLPLFLIIIALLYVEKNHA